MTFVPLVTAWENSRQERTPMPGQQRVASVEYEHGTSERPATFLEWLLDLDREQDLDDPDRDDEEREAGG
ncbi:hypothetical protein [Actinomycetospora soli]|uniref:hypothetical protein n=1 Tax=Actinomycetospora soli TaxID=2893887 RepID=UPI001E61F266|nr:hypothetical protein [Actinomycetospora soli]MCD2190972.1 hypothetical protein [Actinomycetospora soli]